MSIGGCFEDSAPLLGIAGQVHGVRLAHLHCTGLVIVTLIPRVFRRRSQLGQGNVMQDPISATTSERRRPGDDKTAQVWMLGATAWMLGATVWMLGAT
eukprot:5959179-Pyramimonas_sp.AAC.1